MNSYTNQQNAYRKASVNTLDQNKLIVMLYDGAIKQAGFAVEHIKKNEIEKAHNALVKAKNIVSELMSSLNMEKGGEVAKNLKSLYAFMFSQLIEANMNNEVGLRQGLAVTRLESITMGITSRGNQTGDTDGSSSQSTS